ncbi:MAG: hypothetical protein ACREMA_08755 [Longimicrobiales bacterium]
MMRNVPALLVFLVVTVPVQTQHHANAVAAGYRRFGNEGPLMGEHWYHPELVRKPLDLEHPATLQYATINGRRTLVGVAYNVYQRPGEPLPEGFAGSNDHWHVHDVPKLACALVTDRPLLRRLIERRAAQGKIGAMQRPIRPIVLDPEFLE